MNAYEWGSKIYVSTGFDMSGYVTLALALRNPAGIVLTRTPVLGMTTFTDPVSGITFTANEYVSYVVQPNDITTPGTWAARVVYTDAIQNLPSDFARFFVGP